MSSEDSDPEVDERDLPSAAECEQRCQRFAEVTGTDTALAMFFLQDRQWNVEKALNAFFEQSAGAGSVTTGELFAGNITATAGELSAGNMPGAVSLQSQPQGEKNGLVAPDLQPHRVRILSWNIDGLDSTHLKQRAKAVVDTILKEKVEVVLLQEVVPGNEAVLREALREYTFVCGGTGSKDGYYTAILLHKHHCLLDDCTILPFCSSQMGRNLMLVSSTVKGVPMMLMTSHLESTKPHAVERKRQLQKALKHMTDSPPDRTVVFGGDLNVRDKEMEAIGGLPAGIVDVWEATGSRKEARYTWDTFRNDNLGHEGKWRTRMRFDRLFLRQCASSAKLKPVYFELVGLERLPGVQRFPSDHWGILTHWDIVPLSDKSI